MKTFVVEFKASVYILAENKEDAVKIWEDIDFGEAENLDVTEVFEDC